jgi:hypothetical protein
MVMEMQFDFLGFFGFFGAITVKIASFFKFK